MKKLLAAVLVAFVVGVMLPVEAHHNDQELRNKIANLRDDVELLQKKTRYMVRAGYYVSFIQEWQVLSLDTCDGNDDAVWVETGSEGIAGLGCTNGPYTGSAEMLQRFAR